MHSATWWVTSAHNHPRAVGTRQGDQKGSSLGYPPWRMSTWARPRGAVPRCGPSPKRVSTGPTRSSTLIIVYMPPTF